MNPSSLPSETKKGKRYGVQDLQKNKLTGGSPVVALDGLLFACIRRHWSADHQQCASKRSLVITPNQSAHSNGTFPQMDVVD